MSEYSVPVDTIDAIINLFSIKTRFVPASLQTDEWRKKSFNWNVELLFKERPLLTITYSKGWGHSPNARARPPGKSAMSSRLIETARLRMQLDEIEKGRLCRFDWNTFTFYTVMGSAGVIPPPTVAEILCSLASDSSVLDYASFEDWAPCLGYDPDSISAKAIYDQCLKIGLALRNNLGNEKFETLCEWAREQ